MRADISWWSSLLPLFNGVSLIKATFCDFSDLHFSTDASLTDGGAIGRVLPFSILRGYSNERIKGVSF